MSKGTKRLGRRWLVAAMVTVLLGVILTPSVVRWYWGYRASNPVRRGAALSVSLGCYHCHGNLGDGGLVAPGGRIPRVPGWIDGEWMDYVLSDDELRLYILDGRLEGAGQSAEAAPGSIRMPAFRDVLDGTDLEDLVAAFKVVSGMVLPPPGSSERRGHDLARKWECFACHGVAGAGGLPNPASFAGFIPGWYGADFHDLVRDRVEFDTWIREGIIPRLATHPIASRFLKWQRVDMPAYPDLTAAELDDLWAYCQWLARTDGGHRRQTGS